MTVLYITYSLLVTLDEMQLSSWGASSFNNCCQLSRSGAKGPTVSSLCHEWGLQCQVSGTKGLVVSNFGRTMLSIWALGFGGTDCLRLKTKRWFQMGESVCFRTSVFRVCKRHFAKVSSHSNLSTYLSRLVVTKDKLTNLWGS